MNPNTASVQKHINRVVQYTLDCTQIRIFQFWNPVTFTVNWLAKGDEAYDCNPISYITLQRTDWLIVIKNDLTVQKTDPFINKSTKTY